MSEQDRKRPEDNREFKDANLSTEANREKNLPGESEPAHREVLPPIPDGLIGKAPANETAEEPAPPDASLAPRKEDVRADEPVWSSNAEQTTVDEPKGLLPPVNVSQVNEAGREEYPVENREETPTSNEQSATEENAGQPSPAASATGQIGGAASLQIPGASPAVLAIGSAAVTGGASGLAAAAGSAEESADEKTGVEETPEGMRPVVSSEEKPGAESERSEPPVPWVEKEAYGDSPDTKETSDSTSAGIPTEPAGLEMPVAGAEQETADDGEASVGRDDDAPASDDAKTAPVAEPASSALAGLNEITAPDETVNTEDIESREDVVDDLAHIIEAIIFASDEPLPVSTIRSVLDAAHTFGRTNSDMITSRIAALNAKYEAEGSGFCIVEIANGYQYATRKEMAQWVSNLFKERSKRRLSNSALETVAIIAYKQPITKPEIESIRGVNVDYVLHNLLEKELVTVVGRAETVGRPLLYGTTQKFMKVFTLKSLDDLPKLREIEEIIKEIRSKGAEESIQLEITALGDSSAPEPALPETKTEVSSENGTE